MQVLHVGEEMFPLLKTGGLADVTGALPAAQIAEGLDTRVLLPGFPAIRNGVQDPGNDSNLLIVFYVQIVPDDFVMQLHRF